jgi:hypothetical protein
VRLAALVPLWALWAGCYSTPQPNCAFRCGVDSACPSGYACDPADEICHLVVGDTLAECETVVTPDAGTTPDGRPTPDARVPNQFDASPGSGEPDAPASEPDAPISEPDAAPSEPDAQPSVPDARPTVPDAAPTIDAGEAIDAST